MNEMFESANGLAILFVALRIGAMLAVAPMFGSTWVALRYRAAIAGLLTLLVMPSIGTIDAALPSRSFVESIAGELAIGLLLGLGIRILLF